MGTGTMVTISDSTGSITFGKSEYNAPRYLIYPGPHERSDSEMDPEEVLLSKLQTIERYQRRDQAHHEINEKRKAVDMSSLLAQFDAPENRIIIGRDDLQEILDSYPEDD